jgi:hypothetical protein
MLTNILFLDEFCPFLRAWRTNWKIQILRMRGSAQADGFASRHATWWRRNHLTGPAWSLSGIIMGLVLGFPSS